MKADQVKLSELKNIGKVGEGWLNEVGIMNLADLEEVGVIAAYQRVAEVRPREVSLNMLYALQGALLNLHWNELPEDMKEDLRRAVGRSG